MISETRMEWIAALAILLGAALIGYLARSVFARRLRALAGRTATDLDDLAVAVARRHLPLWFLLAGAMISAQVAPLPPRLAGLVTRLAEVSLLLAITFATARIGSALLGRSMARASGGLASTSLAQYTLRSIILAIGGLLVLSNLGISITPLITALGVGSLAVALALQPTLSNLFAGIHISLARPIRVGDFVELETGVKGLVEDIGWRSIRIRELPDNAIIVPNARVADMIVTNYSLPEPEQAVLVQVGVAYESDLEKVERVACDVGREVLRDVTGGVPAFEPFIRYHTFGDSSINFTVILRARKFTDRYLLTHEFMKRLMVRFEREGIRIPFPQRVVHHASPAPGAPAVTGDRGAAR